MCTQCLNHCPVTCMDSIKRSPMQISISSQLIWRATGPPSELCLAGVPSGFPTSLSPSFNPCLDCTASSSGPWNKKSLVPLQLFAHSGQHCALQQPAKVDNWRAASWQCSALQTNSQYWPSTGSVRHVHRAPQAVLDKSWTDNQLRTSVPPSPRG